MVTLKKQYAIAMSLQATAIAMIAASELARGPYKMTENGKEGVRGIAKVVYITGATMHTAAHIRLAYRCSRYLLKKVTK